MRHIIKLFLLLGIITNLFYSCTDNFFQRPVGGTTSVDSVFASKINSEKAIATAYAMCLRQGLNVTGWDGNNTYGIAGGHVDNMSGCFGAPQSGMVADNGTGNVNNARSDDSYPFNFAAIRQCYIVIENIDKVRDMTQQEKDMVKAEMKALIAYRYTQMFTIYGGVPIVEKAFTSSENLGLKRENLTKTLDFIKRLCDEAAAVLPASWDAKWNGRVIRSAALAIKAKAILFSARPLFNSATPYLSFGENNNLICFNNFDKQRWQDAVDANLAVVAQANADGIEIINTGNPLEDYSIATSTPGNKETIMVYKLQADPSYSGYMYAYYCISPGNPNGNRDPATGNTRLTYFYLKQYKKANGTDQTWPESGLQPYSDYNTRMQEMEPRFKASFYAYGIDAWNNPGDNNWKSDKLFPKPSQRHDVIVINTKFYYKAGLRSWFEMPLFRLAANYLALAEGYNELGDPTNALLYLNVIRNRAGMPNETETDQAQLRDIIIREWAVEMYFEQVWFQSEKHWKLANIGTEIIGGPIKYFYINWNTASGMASDFTDYKLFTAYQGYWNVREFLSPIPQSEINKGFILQNPGY